MYSHTSEIRVRYGETDQMRYLHHSNYARYYEIARVECLRSLGISYCEMEQSGILMPIIKMEAVFKQPAFYDDLLAVKASILSMPKTRLHLSYEFTNQHGVLTHIGQTHLCFVDGEARKPMRCPAPITEKLSPFFT